MKMCVVRLLAAIGLLVSAGCGASAGSNTSVGGLDSVTVGLIPIVDVAPVYLGIQQGYFKDEKIDLKPALAQGGAALLPAVMSDGYQFGFSNVVSLLQAKSRGLPVELVAPGVSSTGNPSNDYGAVLVRPDSGISSMADLLGKTVATNSTLNINGMLIRDAVDKAGADSSAIHFTEMPYLDMISALKKGQVDAIFEPEPFFTMAKDQGLKPLYSLYASAAPNLQVSSYFTTSSYMKSHGDLVERFRRALEKSFNYATAHPDAARKIVGTYADIDPAVLAKLTLPAWPSQNNVKALEFLADISNKYGVTKGHVDVEEMMNQ